MLAAHKTEVQRAPPSFLKATPSSAAGAPPEPRPSADVTPMALQDLEHLLSIMVSVLILALSISSNEKGRSWKS